MLLYKLCSIEVFFYSIIIWEGAVSHRPNLVDLLYLCKHRVSCQGRGTTAVPWFLLRPFAPCHYFLCTFQKEEKKASSPSTLPAPHFPNPWLAGSLISNRTGRIGSGLEVWHCHNVGGDETALRPTLLDSAWLILGGRCYSACCTFHPPPIDRHGNYSQGEQSACKLISLSAQTQAHTHTLHAFNR